MAQWRGVAVPAGVPGPSSERQEPYCWVFDAFRLDQREARLWRGQEVVPLHPKAFAVLRCLVNQAGQLVTKDALLMTVWPKTAVSEAALTVAIRQLRRVLGDQARTPQFIETVHRRGYRFIAPVAVAEPSPERHQSAGMLRLASPVARVGSTLFVGRESELAQVHQWCTTALQGTRQVGIITGEPGIGKTALVDTLVAQVARRGGPLGRTRTVCGALWRRGAVSARAGGARTPVPGTAWHTSRVGAAAVCAQLVGADACSVAPRRVGGAPACSRHTAQRRMLRELTEGLEAFTTERPLLLVLEDLHWSDRATLEWLAYIARRPDPTRLLILGTYRPGGGLLSSAIHCVLSSRSSSNTASVWSWRWTICPRPTLQPTLASGSRTPDWRQIWRVCCIGAPMGIPYS